MNAKIFSCLSLLVLVFSSCDPKTDYRMILKNSSSYDLKINDNINILRGQEGVVVKSHSTGGLGSNGKCEVGIGGVGKLNSTIPSHPELSVVKDLSDMNNWTYTKSGNGWKGIKATCTATITDNDIKPK